eukprot:423989_1
MSNRKRNEMDYSSDELQTNNNINTKRRKLNGVKPPNNEPEKENTVRNGVKPPNNEPTKENTVRNKLKNTAVLLHNIKSNQFIKVKMYSTHNAYSIVTGEIETLGKKQVKYFDSMPAALDKAVEILTDKLNHGFIIVDIDNLFIGCSFSLSGSFSTSQNALKYLITNHGGTINLNPNKYTNFLIVRNKNANVNSNKCIKGKKLNIPIIIEDFIHDSIQKGQLENYASYVHIAEETVESSSDDSETVTSVLFKNDYDEKQFQDIFECVNESTLCINLHIDKTISVEIAEFATGEWKYCANKKCNGSISILKQSEKIYNNNHRNADKVGYLYCNKSNKYYCRNCMDDTIFCVCVNDCPCSEILHFAADFEKCYRFEECEGWVIECECECDCCYVKQCKNGSCKNKCCARCNLPECAACEMEVCYDCSVMRGQLRFCSYCSKSRY